MSRSKAPPPVHVTEVPSMIPDARAERPTTRPPPPPPPPSPASPASPAAPAASGTQSIRAPRAPAAPSIRPAPSSLRPTSPSMRPVSTSMRPSSRAAPHPSIPPGTYEPAPSFPPDSGALASVARYHQKLAQLQEQLADAQRELSLTNQERAAEAEQYDELSKQMLVLRRHATELESALAVQHELRAAQKDREEELEKEVVALRETLEERLVDRDLELSRLRGEVVTVRELKATRSRELVAVRATAEAKDLRVHELELANASLKREIDKLRTEMARNLSEQLALSAELRVAREEAQKLREVPAAVAALLGGFDEIAGALASLRASTAKALGRAASATKEPTPTPSDGAPSGTSASSASSDPEPGSDD